MPFVRRVRPTTPAIGASISVWVRLICAVFRLASAVTTSPCAFFCSATFTVPFGGRGHLGFDQLLCPLRLRVCIRIVGLCPVQCSLGLLYRCLEGSLLDPEQRVTLLYTSALLKQDRIKIACYSGADVDALDRLHASDELKAACNRPLFRRDGSNPGGRRDLRPRRNAGQDQPGDDVRIATAHRKASPSRPAEAGNATGTYVRQFPMRRVPRLAARTGVEHGNATLHGLRSAHATIFVPPST